MSTTQSVQEYIHDSDEKIANAWLIAVFVGGPLSGVLILFGCIWVLKFFANNLFGCHFRPIHVAIWEWLRKQTPTYIYGKARAKVHHQLERLQERRQMRRQMRAYNKAKHDVEKGTTSMIYHPEVNYTYNTTSDFTMAGSTPEKSITTTTTTTTKKPSSFSQAIPSVAKPKPVLKQHNEVWWKEERGSDGDLSSLVRSIQQTAYNRTVNV